MPSITGIAHIELSVRDLDASAEWYTKVFGMIALGGGREERWGIADRALLHRESRTVLALTQHDANDGAPFVPSVTGLDHLAFAVADRDELRRWEQHLAELGVDFAPILEWPHGASVTARDPDAIAIELYVRGAAEP